MKVAVVGCGYVGLVTGVGLASVGHDVVGIERDPERQQAIADGRLPFHEPGLADALRTQHTAGRFTVAGDAGPVEGADVVLIAVQTPPREDGSIDLRFLEDAVREVAGAPHSSSRRRVLAVRSTVVPGTSEQVVRPIVGDRAAIASNPEFLREGTALEDFLSPDRVVVGTDDDDAWEALRTLYEPLGAPLLRTSPTTAELGKYASNALLATLISYSNEIARIAETLPGVDVENVLEVVRRDRRLTPRIDGRLVAPGILAFLKAGCGFGGSCLPKDLAALLSEQRRRGMSHPLLEAVMTVNASQAEHVVDLFEQEVGGVQGLSVAVLGVAFKGGTDDMREAPGLRILDVLLDRGAEPVVFDPLVGASSLAAWVDRGARVSPTLEDALGRSSACVVTTNAPEFDAVAQGVRAHAEPGYVVFDARRFLEPSSFDGVYRGVGRGPARAGDVSRATIEPR